MYFNIRQIRRRVLPQTVRMTDMLNFILNSGEKTFKLFCNYATVMLWYLVQPLIWNNYKRKQQKKMFQFLPSTWQPVNGKSSFSLSNMFCSRDFKNEEKTSGRDDGREQMVLYFSKWLWIAFGNDWCQLWERRWRCNHSFHTHPPTHSLSHTHTYTKPTPPQAWKQPTTHPHIHALLQTHSGAFWWLAIKQKKMKQISFSLLI